MHNKNPWVTYGEPLQRLREFGVTVKEIDLMDEICLSPEQTRVVCALLLNLAGPRGTHYYYHIMIHRIDVLILHTFLLLFSPARAAAPSRGLGVLLQRRADAVRQGDARVEPSVEAAASLDRRTRPQSSLRWHRAGETTTTAERLRSTIQRRRMQSLLIAWINTTHIIRAIIVIVRCHCYLAYGDHFYQVLHSDLYLFIMQRTEKEVSLQLRC